MSKNSHHPRIPIELGRRLQVLDHLTRVPRTLREYGDFLQECVKKRLEEPNYRAYFQEIYEGKNVFGYVDYKTSHRVQLPHGRQSYVACALDALVEGFFQPVEIDSMCFHCHEPIHVSMSKGTLYSVRPTSTVMWLGASSDGEGPCETYLCPYINLLSSLEHVVEWKTENPTELGMVLTLQQSLELARRGYWDATCYSRPKT